MSNVEQLDAELEGLIAEMESALVEYEKGLSHVGAPGNLHNISKYDIELSNIHNMGLANSLEVTALHDGKYHPGGGTFLLLDRVAVSPLLTHIQNKNNPHGTTLEQLDMYSTTQIKRLFSERLLRTEAAHDSKFLKGTAVNKAKVISDTKTGIHADNIAEGLIPRVRFANPVPISDLDSRGIAITELSASNSWTSFHRVEGNNIWTRPNTPASHHAALWQNLANPARVHLPYGDLNQNLSLVGTVAKSYYTADVTLSSGRDDANWIGLVIAYKRINGINYQLIARVRPAAAAVGRFEICLLVGNTVTILSAMNHNVGNNLTNGWSNKTIRMRVDRTDDRIRVIVSNWGATALNGSLALHANLSTLHADNAMSVFREAAPLGYFAEARSGAVFSNQALRVLREDEYALTGANSFVHMLSALLNSGGSTGNFHLLEAHYNTVAECWNAMVGANVPIGTYLIGHYRRAFNWQLWRPHQYGISQTHYMFHMVAGRRNVDGTTTRIF